MRSPARNSTRARPSVSSRAPSRPSCGRLPRRKRRSASSTACTRTARRDPTRHRGRYGERRERVRDSRSSRNGAARDQQGQRASRGRAGRRQSERTEGRAHDGCPDQRRSPRAGRSTPLEDRPLPVTTSRPVVAVVPFGAKGRDAKAGGIGRQVARRLVERFEDDPNIELRPVFLVAMPETKSDAGYLVFGSTPDPDLAARYGESLGTTHALTGLYREEQDRRAFAATLVDVPTRRVIAEREIEVGPNELHLAEPALGACLADVLGVA